MNYRSLLTVTTFLSLSSFAQTASSSAPKPLLQAAKQHAEAEIIRLKKSVKDAASNPNLVPCNFIELEIQQAHSQWFLDHYPEFAERDAKMKAMLTKVNEKLKSIENDTVSVLVGKESNSSSAEIPVAFKELMNFFRLYDQRLKGCPKDQQKVLVDLMENHPQSNPLGIVLSQARAAGGIISVNLNASLAEPDASYEVVISPKECGYDIQLKISANIEDSKKTYLFSLNAQNQVEASEQSRWNILTKGKIDGMPVDGLLRYLRLQEKMKAGCKANSLTRIPMYRYGTPYVKYAEISSIAQDLNAKGYHGMKFASIAPGTFKMGSPTTEEGRNEEELLHSVTLTKGFEMQTTEITQAKWFEVMNNNPSNFTSSSYCPNSWTDVYNSGMCPNNPVENIRWSDVQQFIQKLNDRKDGYVYRLPTEAEWEYAARARTSTAYFNGNTAESLNFVGWSYQNSSSHTHEVGTAGMGGGANAFGLYDMHGNVSEWTQDWYVKYDGKDQTDPQGPSTGSYRSLRGGDYSDSNPMLRSASRNYSSGYSSDLGARLVRTLK